MDSSKVLGALSPLCAVAPSFCPTHPLNAAVSAAGFTPTQAPQPPETLTPPTPPTAHPPAPPPPPHPAPPFPFLPRHRTPYHRRCPLSDALYTTPCPPTPPPAEPPPLSPNQPSPGPLPYSMWPLPPSLWGLFFQNSLISEFSLELRPPPSPHPTALSHCLHIFYRTLPLIGTTSYRGTLFLHIEVSRHRLRGKVIGHTPQLELMPFLDFSQAGLYFVAQHRDNANLVRLLRPAGIM